MAEPNREDEEYLEGNPHYERPDEVIPSYDEGEPTPEDLARMSESGLLGRASGQEYGYGNQEEEENEEGSSRPGYKDAKKFGKNVERLGNHNQHVPGKPGGGSAEGMQAKTKAIRGKIIFRYVAIALLVILLVIGAFMLLYFLAAKFPQPEIAEAAECLEIKMEGPGTDGSPLHEGYYQLPESPNYDLNVNGGSPRDQQWGTKDLIEVISVSSAQWNMKHSDQRLGMGDLNAFGHLSHRKGIDVDIYSKNDIFMSLPGHAKNGHYNSALAVEFGKILINTGAIDMVFYNDTSVNTQVNDYAKSKKLPGIFTTASGHDDHFHVRIVPGKFKCESTSQGDGTAKGKWIRPHEGKITSPYGWRVHPIKKVRKFHDGIDIAAPTGASIKAADGGEVVFSGEGRPFTGWGNTVVIDHKNGYWSLYGHNQSLLVKKGDKVSQGQVIAKADSTGASTGSHLHFNIGKAYPPTGQGRTIDPETVLP